MRHDRWWPRCSGSSRCATRSVACGWSTPTAPSTTAAWKPDNTSAFNCRTVAGTDHWSEHAYGRAIDINPIENPYADSDGYVSPPEGAPYFDRSQRVKGLIHRGGPVIAAFAAVGWGWGGSWNWPKDYQHFSATGR